VKIGVTFPQTEFGNDPIAIRDYAQAIEGLGFTHFLAYDHVLSADTTNRPGWSGYSLADPFHEIFVLFGYVAAISSKLELVSGVLILPQRQTALVAKQAATLDNLSGGRLVLGVAVGGREDDYEVSGVDFHTRGKRFDAMLAEWDELWRGDRVGPPTPRDRPTLILGGTVDATYERAARYGDGWSLGGGTPDAFTDGMEKMRAAWSAAGRDGEPRGMSLAYISLGDGAKSAAEGYLGDYYGFLGDYVGQIIDSAATDADTIRGYVQGFEAAGCDEFILFPCDPDPGQVDLLADALDLQAA